MPQWKCSVHGKLRSEDHLVDDGSGGWCCSPASQCRSGGKGGGLGPQTQKCSIHGKMRSEANLVDDGAGGWCCPDSDPCRGGGAGGQSYKCSIHGKMRSEAYLIENGSGGWCCSDFSPCKGNAGSDGKQTYMCSIHGKMRTEDYLVDDGAGGWSCIESSPCKGGGRSLKSSAHAGDEVASATAGAMAVSPNDAIKALAKTYPVFKKAWVAYCKAYGQGFSDPSKYDEPYIADFVQHASESIETTLNKTPDADVCEAPVANSATTAQTTKRPADGPPPTAPAQKKKVSIKKSIADEIKRLNESALFETPIKLAAVAGRLSQLGEETALEALAELAVQGGDVEDPNQFLNSYQSGE